MKRIRNKYEFYFVLYFRNKDKTQNVRYIHMKDCFLTQEFELNPQLLTFS